MRVLVVEDSRRLADVIVEGLSATRGWPSTSRATGGRRRRSSASTPITSSLPFDHDLSGITAGTICRMIVEGDNPAMVLMLTTAEACAGDHVAGLSLGADGDLAKPSASRARPSDPDPRPAPAGRPATGFPRGWDGARSAAPRQRPTTAVRSTSPSRSSGCWRRCCQSEHGPSVSAEALLDNRSGTSTPFRSRTPSSSRSAGLRRELQQSHQ